MHSFSITNTSFLNPGLNTISMTVTNSDGLFEAARFEGGATELLIPPVLAAAITSGSSTTFTVGAAGSFPVTATALTRL